MKLSNYFSKIDNTDYRVDLNGVSPEQYPSAGAELSSDEMTVCECWPGNNNTEFPVNTGYSFKADTPGEDTFIPIYCDANISKCKISFNASSDLLSKFDIFTSTDYLSTTPESKENRYTGDKPVYIFFKSKNEGYSIYSPGKHQEQDYDFEEGKSILISGNRGVVNHICRIKEPIPASVIKTFASIESSVLTVDLMGMESIVWESVNTSTPTMIKMRSRNSQNVYVGYASLSDVNYQPKSCYAYMGDDAGEIEAPFTSSEGYRSFSQKPTSETTLLMTATLCSSTSIPTQANMNETIFNRMIRIGYEETSTSVLDYRIGMYYVRSTNNYGVDLYTYRSSLSKSSGSIDYMSLPTYVYLNKIFVSKFDDAYVYH